MAGCPTSRRAVRRREQLLQKSEVAKLAVDTRRGSRALVLGEPEGLQEDATRALSDHVELTFCQGIDSLAGALDREDPDVLISGLNSRNVSELEAISSLLADYGRAVRWLLIVEEHEDQLIQNAEAAGADEILPSPVIDILFRHSALRLAQIRRLSIQSLLLRETVRIMEDCRPLAYCLEPGQLYPLALDLLMRATQRTRGFALFHRDSLPRHAAVAVRGFDEFQEAAVCDALLENKSIELDGFEGISVVDRGELHNALSEVDVESGDLLVLSMGGQGPESGVVCLLAEGQAFGPEEVEKADIVARHGMAALGNAEAYSLAKERAFVDELTQAYNSRYLLTTCENEIKRAERYGTQLSVVFLDLDQFKSVNDDYGHLAGSESLRRLCRVLEQCVREVDTLARYGGDEFAILLIDTDHQTALTVAERIRHRVEDYIFEVARDVRLRLTVSVGVATCPDHGMVRDELLDLADKAMYRAKSDGRNRVCSADDLS